jgi:hypothetical protein
VFLPPEYNIFGQSKKPTLRVESCVYLAKIEVTDIDKHSRLLGYIIIYGCKCFIVKIGGQNCNPYINVYFFKTAQNQTSMVAQDSHFPPKVSIFTKHKQLNISYLL